MGDTDVAVAIAADSVQGHSLADGVSSSAPNPAHLPSRSAIIMFVCRHTRRAPLPPKWSFLGISSWIRQLRGEPAELKSLLQAQFAVPQLVAAGVLVRPAAGDLVLSPLLAAGSTFFIRRDEAGVPVDIASARGAISTDAPPWLALASTRRVNWSKPTERIFLSWDDDDLHVLHRLGYHVLSTAGLDQLSGKQVPLVFDRAACAGNFFPHDFVLVGWRVADLTAAAPSALAGTLAHLTRIPRRYGIDPAQRFKIWLPTAAELRAIRDGVHFKDRGVLRRELSHSLRESKVTPAGALAWLRDQAKPDYAAARRGLLRAVELSREVPLIAEVAAALQQFRRAIERDLTGKFEPPSVSGSGHGTRLGCCAAAELTELYFDTHPLVAAANRVLSGEHPQYNPRLDDENLTTRLKIVDAIAKLARAAGQ